MSPAPPSRKERDNRERKNGKRVDSSEDGKLDVFSDDYF